MKPTFSPENEISDSESSYSTLYSDDIPIIRPYVSYAQVRNYMNSRRRLRRQRWRRTDSQYPRTRRVRTRRRREQRVRSQRSQFSRPRTVQDNFTINGK